MTRHSAHTRDRKWLAWLHQAEYLELVRWLAHADSKTPDWKRAAVERRVKGGQIIASKGSK